MRSWIVIGLLWCAKPAWAAVTNVTHGGGVYTTMDAAIAAAQPGDRLLVTTGTYAESVIINKDLQILGGYDDSFTALVAPFYSEIERNESYAIYVMAAACYLSRLSTRMHPYVGLFCDNAQVTADQCVFSFHKGLNGGVWLQNASVCVLSNCGIGECSGDSVAGGGATVCEGCTLEVIGNTANIGNNWAVRGGGIRVYSNGVLRISDNAKVLQNAAQLDGGGIHGAAGCTIMIDHSFIGEPNGGNVASNAGGGIYLDGGVLTLTNHTSVARNTALAQGGGLRLGGVVQAVIRDTLIEDNHATTFGGGVSYYSWSSAPNQLLLADTLITNNSVTGGTSGGGGLYLSTWQGMITLTNCSIVDNYAQLAGGGIQAGTGTIDLQRVLLMGNRAALGAGGGLVVAGGDVTATDCQFLHNHARLGGGLHAALGQVRLRACDNVSQISINTAEEMGGGISADRDASVQLEPAAAQTIILSFNRAAQGAGLAAVDGAIVSGAGAVHIDANKAALDGGGIFASNAVVQLSAVGEYQPSLWQNSAGRYGGGACVYDTALSACTMSGNVAGDMGGGVRLAAGAILSNCVVAANMATNYGGGVSMVEHASLVSVTVTGNTAVAADAGGIECGDTDPAATCLIRNCLVADNHSAWGAAGCVVYGATLIESTTIAHNHGIGIGMNNAVARNLIVWGNTGGNIDTLSGAPTITYCCSEPGIDATGCISNDPQFASVAAGDFHLLESSPCIDWGANQAWMSSATDLDGNPRIYTWVQYRTDMGCYEFIPEPGAWGMLGVFTIYHVRCAMWRRRAQ